MCGQNDQFCFWVSCVLEDDDDWGHLPAQGSDGWLDPVAARRADAGRACGISRRRPASGPGSDGPDGVKRVLVERSSRHAVMC
jgi:hypothetical protein